MSNKYYTQCGALLKAGANFCTTCGAKAAAQPAENTAASAVITGDDQPEDTPAAAVSAPSKDGPVNTGKAISAISQLIGSTSLAAVTAGEMSFTQPMPPLGGALAGVDIGPVKYLLGGVGRIFKGIYGVLKDTKRLIPVLVISLLWLGLLLLPALGVNPSSLDWLNFLTFANGGTTGGLWGMAGGLIGKGIFAYLITTLLLPVFSGGKPFAGMGSGIKSLFASFTLKDKKALAFTLFGMGLALFAYNFMTGNASLQNSMAGIAAFLIALRSLTNRTGFLQGFIISLFNKSGQGKAPDTIVITRIMAGWAAGFALGVALSATGISSIGYISGLVLVIAGVALKTVSANKNEMAAG